MSKPIWSDPPENPPELGARLRELIVIWRRRSDENADIYGQRNPVAMTFYMCATDLESALDGDVGAWEGPPPK